MTDPAAPDARIEALETRVAYQDDVIEELNKAVTAQWSAIDRLVRQIADLGDRLKEVEHGARVVAPPEPPPPHY